MTAARVALGRYARAGVRKSSTTAAAADCQSATTWLRPPSRTLTAVREPLPPTGKDPNRPAPMFSPPSASSSWSAST